MCKLCSKSFTYPMIHLFPIANSSEQGKDAFHDHSHIRRTAFTDFDALRIAIARVKACVAANNHSLFEFCEQRLKICIRNICRVCCKATDESAFVQYDTKSTSKYPARIRFAFLSDALFLGKSKFPNRMTKLNAKRIWHTDYCRFSQKTSS